MFFGRFFLRQSRIKRSQVHGIIWPQNTNFWSWFCLLVTFLGHPVCCWWKNLDLPLNNNVWFQKNDSLFQQWTEGYVEVQKFLVHIEPICGVTWKIQNKNAWKRNLDFPIDNIHIASEDVWGKKCAACWVKSMWRWLLIWQWSSAPSTLPVLWRCPTSHKLVPTFLSTRFEINN